MRGGRVLGDGSGCACGDYCTLVEIILGVGMRFGQLATLGKARTRRIDCIPTQPNFSLFSFGACRHDLGVSVRR